MALQSWTKTISLGSLTKNGYTQYGYLKVYVEEISTNIENNTSKVYARVYFDLTPDTSGYSWAASSRSASLSGPLSGSYSLSNGASTYWYGNKDYTLIEDTKDISHNSDGTKSITLSASFSSTMTYAGSGEWSFTLTKIPRASTVSVGNGEVTLGNQATITVTRATSSFTHIIKIKDPTSGTIIQTINSVGASTDWTPALTTYNAYIPTETKTFTVICETYSSSTQTQANLIGSKEANVILKVPYNDTTKPTIAANQVQKTDLTTLPSGWSGVFIQNKSIIRFTLTPTIYTGATAKSGGILIDDTSYINQSSNGTSIQIDMNKAVKSYGSVPIKGNVRDSRDFKYIDTELSSNWTSLGTVDVKKYETPNFNGTPIMTRVNIDNAPDDRGTYLSFSVNARASAVTKTGTTRLNSPTFKIKWREQGSTGSWAERSYTGTFNSTTDDFEFICSNEPLKDSSNNKVTISATTAYDIIFEITDAFTSSGTITKSTTINVGADLLHFNVNGHAMAIGQLSTATQNQEKLEVGYDTSIGSNGNNKSLTVWGNIVTGGIIKSNYKFRLGDGTNNIDLFWIEEV